MSKKYIYFKNALPAVTDHFFGNFCKLETESFLQDIEIIENVFQLFQYEDLKLLISKSDRLQRLLTGQLPQNLDHGYLWQGELLPDLLPILQKSSTLSSCIIFLRNTESPPDILKTPFSRIIQQQEIYNWIVYFIPTFGQIRKSISSGLKSSFSEVDTDHSLREFWRNFELARNNGRFFEPYLTENYLKDRFSWYIPLLNFLPDHKQNKTQIVALGNDYLLQEAFISAREIQIDTSCPLTRALVEERALYGRFNPVFFNKAISTMLSQIKLLQTANGKTQKDLFADDAEQLFLRHWEKERERYHLQKLKWISLDLFKFITILHFLIDHKMISREVSINQFFMANFIAWCDRIVNKKRLPDPMQDFQDFLRKRYLEFYVFARIRELAPEYPPDNLSFIDTGDSSDLIILDLTDKSVLVEHEDKLREIFDLPNSSNRDHPDLKTEDEPENWIESINRREGYFKYLGNTGRVIIARLMAGLLRDEAARCLQVWISYLQKISDFYVRLAPGGRLIMILHPFFIQTTTGLESAPLSRILCEMTLNFESCKTIQLQADLDIVFSSQPNKKNDRIIQIWEKPHE